MSLQDQLNEKFDREFHNERVGQLQQLRYLLNKITGKQPNYWPQSLWPLREAINALVDGKETPTMPELYATYIERRDENRFDGEEKFINAVNKHMEQES